MYKIHGDSSDSASVVLTSKDYAKFYEGLDTLAWNKLKVIVAEHSVLFIGYSLEDKNIEDIFEKVLTQIDISKSEFFIAVPKLAEHKLRHFNTICKTTHLPIDGETLLQIVEKVIRENIVFDAIDKKISIDEAQSVAHKHGIEPMWKAIPNGSSTKVEVEDYVVNPFAALLRVNGLTITSSKETYLQMEHFMDDCDCREMILPPEALKQFENINGINIPKKTVIDGKKPNIVKIEKPEQIDKVVLTLDNCDIRRDSITLRSFWGNKRKRVTFQLSTMNISLLYEGNSVSITLSFVDRHTAKKSLDDLHILTLWSNGATLMFSKNVAHSMRPVLRMPPIGDESIITVLSNFIDENMEIYLKIEKLENYLEKEFLIPKEITHADRNAIVKVLSVFEPVDVGGTSNLDLSLKCDLHLYEALKSPSDYSMEMTETSEEQVCLFGHEYVIKEQKTSIMSPVIENADEVGEALSQGKEAIAKIASSTGKLMLRCKLLT